jgi:hypothetical protein
MISFCFHANPRNLSRLLEVTPRNAQCIVILQRSHSSVSNVLDHGSFPAGTGIGSVIRVHIIEPGVSHGAAFDLKYGATRRRCAWPKAQRFLATLFNYREGEWLCLFIELNSVLRLHGLSPCILFAQIAVCKPLAFHSSRGKNSFEVPLRRVQSLQTIPSIFAADSAYFLLVFLSKLLDLLLLSWLTKHTYPLC